MTTILRTCHLCEAMCGLRFEVEGDRILDVKNDPDDPFSRGYCCPKGLAIGRLHHDPDRLTRPLVRGADGALREASWDEALERAADGLARAIGAHGDDALGVYIGNPVVHHVASALGTELVRRLLPTRNRYTANSQDANPQLLANFLMFGAQLSQPVPDLNRTNHLLIIGANPLVSNGSLMTAPRVGGRLREVRARGGRVVVIDPRRTETAKVADEHHLIRPGRDALLMLAMARTLLEEGLADRAFLDRWTDGADRLGGLLAPFSPEAVAPRVALGAPATLDAPTIRRLARELVLRRPSAVYTRVGTATTRFASLVAWAGHLLNLLAGSVDREGGVMFPDGPASWLFMQPAARGSHAAYRSPQGAPEVAGEYPGHILAEQLERGARDPSAPEAISCFLTVGGNPVLSAPNGARIARALEQVGCHVAVDVQLSETARLAHVVLPPRSCLTEPQLDPAFWHLAVEDVARCSPPLVPAPADQPGELELLVRLGVMTYRRLPRARKSVGRSLLARLAPTLTLERVADWGIRFGPHGKGLNPLSGGLSLRSLSALPRGTAPRPLRPRLAERVVRAGGRIDLVPAAFVDDLPRLRALLEAPEPTRDGELTLIGRRQLKSNNSWLHGVGELHGPQHRCTLLLHPDDARPRGLRSGDRARVRSRVGQVEVEVRVSDEVAPGVASLPHGWGHAGHGNRVARASEGPSMNDLTDDADFDVPSGNAVLNGVPVTVERVAAPVSPAPAGALASRP